MRKEPHSDLHGSVGGKQLRDLDQRLLGLRLVPEAHRQEVAIAAVLAGPLVELACCDVPENQADLREVLGEVLWGPFCEVPLDAGLFG
jgi:hypothetical protein